MKNYKLPHIFPYFLTGAIFAKMIDMPWQTGLNALDSVMLDTEYFTSWAGEKLDSRLLKVFEDPNGIVTEARCEDLADYLKNRFGEKWNSLWKTLSFEYNPIHNYDATETGNNQTDFGMTVDTHADSNNDVYGFNDDSSSVPESKAHTEGGQVNGGKDKHNYTWHREGNIGVMSTQDLINQERAVWQWSYIEQLFRDVDSVITIPIFTLEEKEGENHCY